MELHFLGTGAGVPSKGRNVSSIALTLPEYGGRMWLFDCGEGTQHQILNSSLKLSKMEKLFITHMHGDHIFGIPGTLGSRSFQGGVYPLTIYGPSGIRHYLETVLSLSRTHLPYEWNIVEITDGMIIEDPDFTIKIAQLDHVVPSFGFRLVEHDSSGKLQVDRLQAIGIPPGSIYGKIKRGETVQLPNGRTIDGNDFLGPRQRGRIVTILGDTRRSESAISLAENADVLVHEATYSEHERELAHTYFHSTATEAAMTAREAHVSTLILTHISPRYHGREQSLLTEARHIFDRTYLARDLWSYTISQ